MTEEDPPPETYSLKTIISLLLVSTQLPKSNLYRLDKTHYFTFLTKTENKKTETLPTQFLYSFSFFPLDVPLPSSDSMFYGRQKLPASDGYKMKRSSSTLHLGRPRSLEATSDRTCVYGNYSPDVTFDSL